MISNCCQNIWVVHISVVTIIRTVNIGSVSIKVPVLLLKPSQFRWTLGLLYIVTSWDVSGLEIDLVVKEKMIQSTDESGLKMWTCSCCGYVSKKTTNMYKHIERKHLLLALKCNFCLKEFSNRNDYNVHVKSFHNWFYCQEMFLFLSKMIKLREESGTLWKCTDCSYSSKNKFNVYEHVKSRHVGSFGYYCQLCDKSCPSRNAFRIHNIRYHSNKD